MKILMLVSDAHGGFGGISQYNRDVIDAMSGFAKIDEIVVVPRVIETEQFEAPAKVRYAREGSRSLSHFLGQSFIEAIRRGGFDLVYCAHINLTPVAAAISRMLGLPLALAIYGTDGWEPPGNWLTARSLRSVDLVLSISRLTLDRFLAWNASCTAMNAIVPNAVHPERYSAADKCPQLVERYGLKGRSVIMTLGRMHPDERAKGFDEIIELMPRLRRARPDIVYLCAGDGGDRPRLEEKARRLGVDDIVVFTGRVPEERKSDHFRLSDAYVMASRWEGFGFVVIEALACGIPVVASAADGTKEAVRNGELGIVVDPQDQIALERAILEAIERPKQVPSGLDYFSFGNFERRLHAALSKVVPL